MTVQVKITLTEKEDRRISYVLEGYTDRDTHDELQVGNYIRDLLVQAGDAINDNDGHLPDLELVERKAKRVRLPEFTPKRWLYANLLAIPVYISIGLLPPQNPELLHDLLKFILYCNTFVVWFMVAWAWEDTLDKLSPHKLLRVIKNRLQKRKDDRREQAVDAIIDGVLNNTKDK